MTILEDTQLRSVKNLSTPISETQEEEPETIAVMNGEVEYPVYRNFNHLKNSPKPIEGSGEIKLPKEGDVEGWYEWSMKITTQTNLNTTAIKNMRDKQ